MPPTSAGKIKVTVFKFHSISLVKNSSPRPWKRSGSRIRIPPDIRQHGLMFQRRMGDLSNRLFIPRQSLVLICSKHITGMSSNHAARFENARHCTLHNVCVGAVLAALVIILIIVFYANEILTVAHDISHLIKHVDLMYACIWLRYFEIRLFQDIWWYRQILRLEFAADYICQ